MCFTHNGHHHFKKTSPPAITKLTVCRPVDISPALFPTGVQQLNNWRVGMVVTDGLASADLQPPWWRGLVGSHDASSNGNIFRVTRPLCGKFTGDRWITQKKPVTQSFDVFFDLRLNKRLSKQSWGLWLETTSRSLWRPCNDLRT